MTAKCDIFYSCDGENYCFYDLEEAAQEAIEIMEHGDTSLIYEAYAVPHKGSEFFPLDTADRLEENAYNEVGDFMEGWLDKITDEQEQKLRKELGETLDKFLKENNFSPKFFKAKGVKKIKIKCIDYSDLDKSYIIIKNDDD